MSAGSPQTSDTTADDSDTDGRESTPSLYGETNTSSEQPQMTSNFWRPFFGADGECPSPMSESSSAEKESDKESDYDPELDPTDSSTHVVGAGRTERDLFSRAEEEEVKGRTLTSECSDQGFWGLPYDEKVNTDLNLIPLARGAACKEGELTACEALIRLGECRDHLNNVIEPLNPEISVTQERSDRYTDGAVCRRNSELMSARSRSKLYYPPTGEPPLKVLVTDVTCHCVKVTFMECTTEKGFFRNSMLDTN